MRAWLDINLENLHYNTEKLKEISNKKIIAVLKANAYGLGISDIANFLYKSGVDFYAVATVEEGIEIRKILSDVKILVLGILYEEEIEIAQKNNLAITVSDFKSLEFIVKNKIKIDIHLKIDTGMTRIGFNANQLEKVLNYCDENNVYIEGVFSHLSDADGKNEESKKYTKMQLRKFKESVINTNKNFKYIHILNTAGAINYSDFDFGNYARIGIGLYGYMGNKTVDKLKSVFTLKSKILFIKKVEEDTYVSYGRKYKISKGETYAVISLGYADGLKRYLRNGYILVNNHRADIIGEICMDMFMVKIPKEIENNIEVGQEVTVLNEKIINDVNYDDFSLWEVMTGLGKRVKRIYLGE